MPEFSNIPASRSLWLARDVGGGFPGASETWERCLLQFAWNRTISLTYQYYAPLPPLPGYAGEKVQGAFDLFWHQNLPYTWEIWLLTICMCSMMCYNRKHRWSNSPSLAWFLSWERLGFDQLGPTGMPNRWCIWTLKILNPHLFPNISWLGGSGA